MTPQHGIGPVESRFQATEFDRIVGPFGQSMVFLQQAAGLVEIVLRDLVAGPIEVAHIDAIVGSCRFSLGPQPLPVGLGRLRLRLGLLLDGPVTVDDRLLSLLLRPEIEERNSRNGDGQRDERSDQGGDRSPMPVGKPSERVGKTRRGSEDRIAGEIPADVRPQFAGAGVAAATILFQALARDDRHIAAERPVDRRKRRRRGLPHDAGRLVDRFLPEFIGVLAGEQFVEHDAQRIHVGPHVQLIRIGVELFRAHVLKRADELAHVGVQACQGHVGVGASCDPEIDHLGLAAGIDEHVARLQITMDDASLVTVGHRQTDLPKEIQSLVRGELVRLRIGHDRCGMRDELHHEIGFLPACRIVDADGVDLGDAGVSQAAEYPRLVLEPLEQRARRDTRPHHFDGHRAIRMLLPALVDTPHAPLGDESHDLHAVQVGAHERIVSRFLGRFAGPCRRGADAKRIRSTRQQGVVGVDGTGRLLLRGKPVGDHGKLVSLGRSGEKRQAARLGFEPRQREPKSLVLPLHHRAIRAF